MRREGKVGGFTLIELMIAVAIIGILAAVAFPSYTEHLKRGKRNAAQSFMRALASKEEQQLLNTRCYFAYPTDATCAVPSGIVVPSEVSTNYTITITTSGGAGTPPAYTITAARITSVNTDTKCGDLGIDNIGNKTATGTSGATYCWK